MRKIKEILRLHHAGLSVRGISSSLGIGRTAISRTLDRANEAGLVWPLAVEVSEADLDRTLYPPPPGGLNFTDWARPIWPAP